MTPAEFIKKCAKVSAKESAEITIKELARQTDFGEKALHRMLGRRGNPTARSLATIIQAIRNDLGFVPHVSVTAP